MIEIINKIKRLNRAPFWMPKKNASPYTKTKKEANPKTKEQGNRYTKELTPSSVLKTVHPKSGQIKNKSEYKLSISKQ